jgi:hypothetical protein
MFERRGEWVGGSFGADGADLSGLLRLKIGLIVDRNELSGVRSLSVVMPSPWQNVAVAIRCFICETQIQRALEFRFNPPALTSPTTTPPPSFDASSSSDSICSLGEATSASRQTTSALAG